jgi:alkanesulfonate monooxygenase SsuD/methylene tetrahydromethanopterin reductase-like flavin-dependent oxidoreductase (luciferase family)
MKQILFGVHLPVMGKYLLNQNHSKYHPTIFVGTWGSSEAGIKRTAKYGDGWMASAYNITPDMFREKWNILLSYRKRLGKGSESFENCLMSMFGYIDNNRDKVHRMAKDILSPTLGTCRAVRKSTFIWIC